MTTRAERIYLSFFENDNQDNSQRMAAAIRQVVEEVLPEELRCNLESRSWVADEILEIADELEDPNLLHAIYGNCCD